VIPIGRSLMFVEPIYLQAERSPMPELRLVVLATQEKLGYGQNFSEAMVSLFGQAQVTKSEEANQQTKNESAPPGGEAKPVASPSPNQTLSQLVERALQEFEDYQRLTSQGKLAEAGQKLEQHKRTLEEIRKLNPKQ